MFYRPVVTEDVVDKGVQGVHLTETTVFWWCHPSDRGPLPVYTRLQHSLREVRGVAISARTARRRLVEVGLTSHRPAVVLRLRREHRVRRLAYARNHVNWSDDQWSRVLFTDETRVSLHSLQSPDGRERVWRRL
ncbi:hypothetical protein M8J77_020397 [Diaphorina citri]|nr:hypothetical protein M8J77_020397 [Diaphorina citri]